MSWKHINNEQVASILTNKSPIKAVRYFLFDVRHNCFLVHQKFIPTVIHSITAFMNNTLVYSDTMFCMH